MGWPHLQHPNPASCLTSRFTESGTSVNYQLLLVDRDTILGNHAVFSSLRYLASNKASSLINVSIVSLFPTLILSTSTNRSKKTLKSSAINRNLRPGLVQTPKNLNFYSQPIRCRLVLLRVFFLLSCATELHLRG